MTSNRRGALFFGFKDVPPELGQALEQAFGLIESQLDELRTKPIDQQTQTSNFTAAPGQTLTLEAPISGINGTLVQARSFNKGKRITFIQRNTNPVRFRALEGTVNGVASVVSVLRGTYEAISDGAGGWHMPQLLTATGALPAVLLATLPALFGPQGEPGQDGQDGFPGRTGDTGPAGATGPSGDSGPTGPMGISGQDGSDGSDGIQGPTGPAGAIGPTGPSGSSSAIATVVSIDLGSTPAQNGSFLISGLSGLTIGVAVFVQQAADDQLELDSLVCAGVVESATTIRVYWHNSDDQPVNGVIRFQYLVAAPGTLATSGNAITVSSTVDLTGSTSTINVTPTAGALGVVDISALLCGGVLTFQSLTAATIDGFTAKTNGFWFTVHVRDATTAEYLVILDNVGALTTSVQTPQVRDWRLGKSESIVLVYNNNRWRVSAEIPKLWQVSADNVTFAATQNNYTRSLPNGVQSVVRITLTGDQQITGLVPDNNGEILTLLNIDTVDTLTVVHEGASSTAANRFTLPLATNLLIGPGGSATFRYDGTSSRWRPIDRDQKFSPASMATLTTVTNATTAISLALLTVPANTLAAGACFEFFGAASYQRTGAGAAVNANLSLLVNGTVQAVYSTALSAAAGPSNDASIHGFFNFTTIGAAGVARGRMSQQETQPAGAITVQNAIVIGAIDTTAAVTIEVQCALSVAVVATTITGLGGLVQQRARSASA